jgi:hypothetical protein
VLTRAKALPVSVSLDSSGDRGERHQQEVRDPRSPEFRSWGREREHQEDSHSRDTKVIHATPARMRHSMRSRATRPIISPSTRVRHCTSSIEPCALRGTLRSQYPKAHTVLDHRPFNSTARSIPRSPLAVRAHRSPFAHYALGRPLTSSPRQRLGFGDHLE